MLTLVYVLMILVLVNADIEHNHVHVDHLVHGSSFTNRPVPRLTSAREAISWSESFYELSLANVKPDGRCQKRSCDRSVVSCPGLLLDG